VKTIVAEALGRLRESLPVLLQKVEASGLTPETFMGLVSDLKTAFDEYPFTGRYGLEV
jgi:hypothetical protein